MWIWTLVIKGTVILSPIGRRISTCFEILRLRLRTTLRVGLLRRLRLLAMTGGQVILEFTFCMIIILLMIYGLTKVAFWTGKDFAARSISHDNVLTTRILEDYGGSPGDGPLRQIDPYFYTPIGMNAIWEGQ